MNWKDFLKVIADRYKLLGKTKEVFLLILSDENKHKAITNIATDSYEGYKSIEKQLTQIYKAFSEDVSQLAKCKKGKLPELRLFLEDEYKKYIEHSNQELSEGTNNINWNEICGGMLKDQKQLSSNVLLHDDENNKFKREQIYVPLALVERKKTKKDNPREIINPEDGTKIYEPQYEQTQQFEYEDFLKQILEKGEGKTKGEQVALIAEPGAGKTTLLQAIADWILDENLGIPIWISLADLERDNVKNISHHITSDCLDDAIAENELIEQAKSELKQQIKEKKVWLLLDGVDEVTNSGKSILKDIFDQLQGWFQPRVILTCRLNVWEANNNALANFETYRLLDFNYPQQVHQFIDNWFHKNCFIEIKEKLKTELDNPEKARLRNLIQNPLRLTLLCASWQRQQAKLPDTKAQLYEMYIDEFYNWKPDIFKVREEEKKVLNQALGELAKKDIEEGKPRFRLRKSFIKTVIEDEQLVNKILQLGLLNKIGIAEESYKKEDVYAFLHPTFQEYFAALAIDDWDFFFPKEHINKPVANKKYRIFDPKWKEVILLWIGRGDISTDEKEKFIKALIEFKDGCKDFYSYRAYFLAAVAIDQFKDCSLGDQIVEEIVNWSVGKKTFYFISQSAYQMLPETDRERAIAALIDIIDSADDELTRWKVAECLGKIDAGNEKAIKALIDIIRTPKYIYTCFKAAESLGKIGQGNEKVIADLINIIYNPKTEDIRWIVADCLGKIDPGNKKATNALIQIIRNSQNYNTRIEAAESLVKIGEGNNTAINILIELIYNSGCRNTIKIAAESLGKIDRGNRKAIDALIELIKNFPDDSIRSSAAKSLGEIGQGTEDEINALIDLIKKSWHHGILLNAAESLGKIGQGTENEINALIYLINNCNFDNIQIAAAASLGKIDPGKEKAINALIYITKNSNDEVMRWYAAENLRNIDKNNDKNNCHVFTTLIEIIKTSQSQNTLRLAAYSLEKIIQDEQMPEVIKELKEYLSDEMFNNHRDRFDTCYQIMWKCAQTLTYPEFYEAWHS